MKTSIKPTAYLRTYCDVDFPLNQQTQKTKGHVYITAPKHVFDELVRLNGIKFKGKFLFIEIVQVKPKVTNPNNINFTSPNRFEPLRFVNNIRDPGNDIDHCEESNLRVDFKRTARNSQQNSKCISKRTPHLVVNAHKTTFSKVPIIPGYKTYSDPIKKNRAGKYIDF